MCNPNKVKNRISNMLNVIKANNTHTHTHIYIYIYNIYIYIYIYNSF